MLWRSCFGLLLLWPALAGAHCAALWKVPFEEWRPYSYVDTAGQQTGLETELLAAVARELDCEVAYVRDVPRNRRLSMLAAGELDLLVAASADGPNSPPLAWYTLPYRDEEYAVFVLAGSNAGTGLPRSRSCSPPACMC